VADHFRAWQREFIVEEEAARELLAKLKKLLPIEDAE
jgi:hypothetical protein